jgi:hypothetical protein
LGIQWPKQAAQPQPKKGRDFTKKHVLSAIEGSAKGAKKAGLKPALLASAVIYMEA